MKTIQTVYFPLSGLNNSQAAAYVAGAKLYPELEVIEDIRKIKTPWMLKDGTQLMIGPDSNPVGATSDYHCFTFSVPEAVYSGEEREYYVFTNRTLVKCDRKPEIK